MQQSFKRWVAIILTVSVILMTLLAILSIWGVFNSDVAWKALSTLGVVFISSAITLVIIKIVDDKVKID